MNQAELTEIIESCRKGNARAFRILVLEYQERVFSVSLKMLCDEDEAKDAVQETFLRIWRRIGDYAPEKGNFSTWIYAIATRICLDRMKHRRRWVALPEEELRFRPLFDNGAERRLEAREWLGLVKVLASKLGRKQQTVFTLSALEGLSHEEIAQITGLSAEKIKGNLYAARQKIKEQLKLLGYGTE